MNKGVLLVRDIGDNSASWWFAIPGVSPFIKSLTKGRSMVQQMLKKTKYKEMLKSELMGRKLSVSKFSMEFHLHDLVGADIVEWYRILFAIYIMYGRGFIIVASFSKSA